MGLLRNVNENGDLGAGAIIFWAIVGTTLGTGFAYFAALPTGVTAAASLIGFGVGIALGFYASFGTTRLARILALPGITALFGN
jgi:hypothetical protein